MSRNLGMTTCYFCGGTVNLTGEPHNITREEAGAYFDEYRCCVFANAECSLCGAKYLAWMDTVAHGQRHGYEGYKRDANTIYDLSFRSTFDDEPGEADKPIYTPAPAIMSTDTIAFEIPAPPEGWVADGYRQVKQGEMCWTGVKWKEWLWDQSIPHYPAAVKQEP